MSYFNDYGSWQRLLHDLNLDWIVRRINKNAKDIEYLKQSTVTPNINATASVDNTTGNPSVNVSKDIIDDTTTFNFEFSGLKGQPGPTGSPGPSGSPGVPGEDGFSPVVSVEEVSNGHTVTITDKSGPKEFTITNGVNGQPGPAGPAGPSNVESYESTGRAIANINGTDIKIPNIYPSYIISAAAESILTLNSGVLFQPGSNTLTCQAINVSNVTSVEGSNRGIKHINAALIIYNDILEASNIFKLATISNKLFERFNVEGDLIQYCNNVYYINADTGNYMPITMNSYNKSPRIIIKVETNASGGTEHNIYLELEDRADFYGINGANGLFVVLDITYM